ncbi:MAG: hypothetical protein OM95_10400 [Bdellovibrio sp. ArHS]|uniref:TIGR02147 family protein n=1 Tax=Bdellovibrio sp. ArHS TaxID=1569284 RepID=UPI0005832C63|nr:TIGR02147 family protein [Bdellovibrio sp. ArHS]KHD88171.1 MAG: hypothetical protein OM95_10400 [Bdellovibrio sp. ArHS]
MNVNSSLQKKPQLRDYLEASFYLRDLYNYRKATEESFSYESWAFELDFQHRSFLRQVVIGRRALTETTAQQIAHRLFTDPKEQRHFMILFHYSRSRSQQEREIFGQQLMQMLKDNYAQMEVEPSEDFLSSPLFPRLQVLLSLGDQHRSLQELSRLLQADSFEIEKGLLILTRLQLAQKTETGYKATVNSFKIPNNLGSQVLLDYHQSNLQDAIKARSLPPELRRYKSFILALAPSEFEQFLKNMDAFVKEQLHRFDTSSQERRRLFQVSMNLFSVSTELDV